MNQQNSSVSKLEIKPEQTQSETTRSGSDKNTQSQSVAKTAKPSFSRDEQSHDEQSDATGSSSNGALSFEGLDQQMNDIVRKRPMVAMAGILVAGYLADLWMNRQNSTSAPQKKRA